MTFKLSNSFIYSLLFLALTLYFLLIVTGILKLFALFFAIGTVYYFYSWWEYNKKKK